MGVAMFACACTTTIQPDCTKRVRVINLSQAGRDSRIESCHVLTVAFVPVSILSRYELSDENILS